MKPPQNFQSTRLFMQFKGIGPSLGPQLMAEIGDITNFTHIKSPYCFRRGRSLA